MTSRARESRRRRGERRDRMKRKRSQRRSSPSRLSMALLAATPIVSDALRIVVVIVPKADVVVVVGAMIAVLVLPS